MDGDDTSTSRPGSAGASTMVSMADTVFIPEHHRLVHNGDISTADLRLHYNVSLTTLATLLQTQTQKLKETTLKGLCDRLKVRNAGSTGAALHKTLHGLVMRVLPATVLQQREPARSMISMSSVSSWPPHRGIGHPKNRLTSNKLKAGLKAGQVSPVELYTPEECDV